VWQPAAAPQLAEATGDFFLIGRADGIKQWAYKGRGLYTFGGDLAPGDANGVGVNPKLNVAAVATFFIPPDVTLRRSLNQGYVLATKSGMTLYRRDGYIFQSGGGHSLRRGQPARPAVGRDIGTDARCEGECARLWHPFAAPAEAKPQGFWDVATRTDGTRQWVYQGYALWTYDGDKRPGDMNGNDTFTYAFSDLPSMAKDGPKRHFDFGTPMDGAPALYWAIAVP
jgi:predicted lipoprotein with Yx(FWY)xxD motif